MERKLGNEKRTFSNNLNKYTDEVVRNWNWNKLWKIIYLISFKKRSVLTPIKFTSNRIKGRETYLFWRHFQCPVLCTSNTWAMNFTRDHNRDKHFIFTFRWNFSRYQRLEKFSKKVSFSLWWKESIIILVLSVMCFCFCSLYQCCKQWRRNHHRKPTVGLVPVKVREERPTVSFRQWGETFFQDLMNADGVANRFPCSVRCILRIITIYSVHLELMFSNDKV